MALTYKEIQARRKKNNNEKTYDEIQRDRAGVSTPAISSDNNIDNMYHLYQRIGNKTYEQRKNSNQPSITPYNKVLGSNAMNRVDKQQIRNKQRQNLENDRYTQALRSYYNQKENLGANALNERFNFGNDKTALTGTESYAKKMYDEYIKYKNLEENKKNQAELTKQIKDTDSKISELNKKYEKQAINDTEIVSNGLGGHRYINSDKTQNNEYLNELSALQEEKKTLQAELDKYKEFVDYSTEDDFSKYKFKGEADPNNAVRFFRTHNDEQANKQIDITQNSGIDTLHHETAYTGGGSNQSDRDFFRSISQEEADNYSYLLGKYGQEKADEYLQGLAKHTDVNNQYAELEKAREKGQKNILSASAESLGLGLATPFETAKNIISGDEYRTIDDYSLVNRQNYLRQGAVDTITDVTGSKNVLPLAYNTTMSGLDNYLRYTVGSIFGGAAGSMGASEQLAGDIGKGAMRGMMAGQVMDQSMSEALNRGLSNKDAVTTALIAAFNEELFETISLEQLDAMKASDINSLKDVFKNASKQFVTEGSEEVFTDIGNAIADDLVNGDDSEIQQSIRQYLNEGKTMEEAKRKAATDFALQLVESGLSGGLTGVGMGAGVSANNLIDFNNSQKYEKLVDNYVSQGFSTNEARQMANEAYKNELAQNKGELLEGKTIFTGKALNKAIKATQKLADNVGKMESEANEYAELTQPVIAENATTDMTYEDMYNAYNNVNQAQFNDRQAETDQTADFDKNISNYISKLGNLDNEQISKAESNIREATNFENDLYNFIKSAPKEDASTNEWVKFTDKINKMTESYPEETNTIYDAANAIAKNNTNDFLNNYFGENLNNIDFKTSEKGNEVKTEKPESIEYNAEINGQYAKIVDAQGDNITIEYQDGTTDTLKANDVNMSEGTQAAVDIAKTYGNKGSKLYLENMNSNVRAYTNSFNTFYNAGRNGTDFGNIQATNFNNLSDDNNKALELAYEIYYAGAADSGKNNKQGGLVRNEYRHQVDERTARTLDDLGKALGVTIELDGKITHDANGVYEDGRIHISLDTDKPILVVLAHELTHRLAQTSPDAYKAYEKYVIEKLKESGKYEERLGKLKEIYANKGENLDKATVNEELAANATEMFLMDEDFVNDFVEHHKSFAEKILDTIKQILSDIKEMIKTNYAPNSLEAKVISQNTEVLNECRDLWVKAIEKQDKKLMAKENAKDNTDNRFSLKEPVEETKDLIAVHNLSIPNLENALEKGGFPSPSIAIRKAKTGHNNFGKVSVVFYKDTIDPEKNKSNKVYNDDVFSPRYPTTLWKKTDVNKFIDKYKLEDKTINELNNMDEYLNDGDFNYYLSDNAPYYKLYYDKKLQSEFLRKNKIKDNLGIGFDRLLDVRNKKQDYQNYINNLSKELYESVVTNEIGMYNRAFPSEIKMTLPNNLENIVKIMNEEGKHSKQVTSESTKDSSKRTRILQQLISKEFNNINEIKNNESKLEFDELKAQDLMNDITHTLDLLEDELTFNTLEDIAIGKALKNSWNTIFSSFKLENFNKENVRKIFKDNGINFTDAYYKQMENLRKELENAPKLLFEAKPQRVVGTNEIAFVVLPSFAEGNKKLIDLLKENNITYNYYDFAAEDSDKERIKALNSRPDVMFSLKEELNDNPEYFNLETKDGLEKLSKSQIKDLQNAEVLYEKTDPYFLGMSVLKTKDNKYYFTNNHTVQQISKEAVDFINEEYINHKYKTFNEKYDFYKKYQDGTADEDSYYYRTIAKFEKIDKSPDRQPDYVSRSGSRYWYTNEGVIRQSDHWGDIVASCSWNLGNQRKSLLNKKAIAFCKWEDFEYKTSLKANDDNVYELSSFNNPNPKFSLKEDSEGRELSKQQQEYFKDSKAVDENGRLLVLYHGTKAHYFTKFNTNNGTWLSTDINYSAQYASKIPKLLKQFTSYTNNKIFKYDRISEDLIKLQEISILNEKEELEKEKKNIRPDKRNIERLESNIETQEKFLKEFKELFNKQDIVKENDKRIYELYANIHNPLEVGYTTKEAEKEMPKIIEKMSLTEKDKNSVMNLVKPLDWVWEIIRKPEFINIAKKYGYDSIIAQEFYGSENPPTTICVFNSNQIKNVANKKPTDNPDIRFSLKEDSPITNNTIAEITSKNEFLADEIKNLEDMLTSGRMFFKANQRELFQVYDEIAKEYKINNYSKKQFADNMNILFEYIADVDVHDPVTTMTLATMIAYDMIDTAGIKDTWMQEEYEGLQDFIKATRFKIADQDKNDLDGGYDYFRKKYFGKLTLAKDGIAVDSKYQELNEMYPELFPESITHPAEQLMRIGEVMDMFDSVVDSVEGATREESAFIIARDILDKTLLNNTRGKEFDTKEKLRFQEKLRKSNTNLRRAKKDIKEEYEILLNKVKAIEGERKRLERANQRLERQMGKQMKDFADFAADEKALKKAGKLQRENERLKAKFAKQEVAKQQRKYSQERRKNLEKIKKMTNELSRSLLHPDKTHYVPRGLVASMLEVAKMIDLDSGYRNPDGSMTNIYMKLKEMQNQYRKMQDDGDYAIKSEYNETVDKAIGRLAELTKGKRVNELMDKDIEEVANIMTIINHELKVSRDIINGENLKDVKEAAEKGISQIKAANRVFNKNKILKNKLNAYLNNMLSPVRVFKRLDNYAQDGVMTELGHMLEQGERKTKVIKYKAMDMLADLTKDKESRKKYEEFRTKKLNYTIGGKTITITPDMRVAIYLHSLNEQNMKHLSGNKDKDGVYHGGGVIIPNYNKAMLQKDRLDLDPTEKYTGVGSIRLSPETVKKIVGDMTDYEKMVAEKYREVNNYLTEELNKATMDLYGFKKATVENYFPLIVDKSILQLESEALKMDKTLESFGFLKERVNSAKPIYLEGVMDALYRQIDQSSLFSGMAIPSRNFSKVYNYTTQEEGNENGQLTNILKESEKAFGSYMTKYIDNLKSDLAQARPKETSEIAKVFSRGKMATGVLTGNLSVVMKQMASYPTAAGGDLDFRDLIAGLSYQGRSSKDLTELINKYSPYLRDRNTSTIAGMNITDLNVLQRKNPKLYYALTGWIEATDKATVRRLWYAAENYVKRNYKLEVGSDAYYEQVAEVWEDTLRRTQPIYDTMSRPEDLRQTGELKKWLMMFKTQAFQNIGIMVDSYGELVARTNDYKNNKTDINKTLMNDAQRQFRKAVTSQIIQSMVFAAMTALADAIKHRPDDWVDKETGQFTAESFLKHYGDSIISNTIGQLAYGDIIRDFTYGPLKAFMGKDTHRFDTEIIPISVLNDTVNNVQTLAQYTNKLVSLDENDYASESAYKADKKKYTDKIVQTIESISKEGMQYGLGLPINNVEKLLNGITENVQDIKEGKNPLNVSSDKQQYNRIYNAYKAGDPQLAQTLSTDIDDSKLKTNMVNRLKDEKDIKAAADYRYNGNTDAYQTVIDKYVNDGFDEKWVVSAINSDMNKKYGTSGSTTNSIYNANDLERAIDISANQGSKIASQMYDDKVNEYIEEGQTTDDAKKKALSSVKSSITSKYKSRYENGTTHDKVLIRDTLTKIRVNGQQIYTYDDISKWN